MLKRLLITILLMRLVGRKNTNRINKVITTVSNYKMGGEEKRQYVLQELSDLKELSDWTVNLAIELLVAKNRI